MTGTGKVLIIAASSVLPCPLLAGNPRHKQCAGGGGYESIVLRNLRRFDGSVLRWRYSCGRKPVPKTETLGTQP